MTKLNEEDRLRTDEDHQKAETLFSKKFRDYLSSKKSSKINEEKYHKPTKDYSASSGETSESESSKKSGGKVKKKPKDRQPQWDYNHAVRNRITQCSLLKSDETVAPPEDLKPLLLNMTILLHDLKQFPSQFENLYDLISRITILVTEFIRRPLKKTEETNGEQTNKVEKTIEMMLNLLQEYKNGPNLDLDNRIREFKRLEKEIAHKTSQIAEVEKKLSEEVPKIDLKVKDINLRVRNSIMANEKLKSEIKFNREHAKRYKKVLLEKEWTKHKLELELSNLKKKMSKVDFCEGEPLKKQTPDSAESTIKSENSSGNFPLKSKTIKLKKGRDIQKYPVMLNK